MITISNLTPKQKAMMDTMWSMDDMDKVTAFIRTLPLRDQQDCMSLITIATQESHEQDGGLEEYADITRSVISRCSS